MSYASTVLADSPVAFLQMQETAGTNALDSVSSESATYVNAVLNQTGPFTGSKSVLFDGATCEVDLSTITTNIDFTAPFSVELFINPNLAQTADDTVVFVSRGDGGFDQFYFGVGGSRGLIFGTFDTDSGEAEEGVLYDATMINKWYHVVGVFTGTSFIIYKNNVNVASAPFTGTIEDIGDGYPLIGAESSDASGTGQRFFSGLISYVSFYNFALNSGQVANHYNAAFPPTSTSNVTSTMTIDTPTGRSAPNALNWLVGQPKFRGNRP